MYVTLMSVIVNNCIIPEKINITHSLRSHLNVCYKTLTPIHAFDVRKCLQPIKMTS